MAKNENQKLKILYILDILAHKTDVDHGITMQELILQLEALGICAERKSVYNDIFLLREQYGTDIEMRNVGSRVEYRMASRDFELPELKLLVDAVQSSKFITHKKSLELIAKLENLTSEHNAGLLKGQVYVTNRIKTMNESIYYNVNSVNEAISGNRKITFRYFDWMPSGEKKLRRNGELYTVSPWYLCWNNENYYMIALENDKIKHYRVDKMLFISCIDKQRDGSDIFKNFDAALYSQKMFGMFGGRQETVILECDNSLTGAIIDRFGKNVMMIPHGDTFTVTLEIEVSPQFFAWITGFSTGLRIISPSSVINEYKSYILDIMKNY